MIRLPSLAFVMAGCLCSSALALGADRTAEQVLKEIDAIKTRSPDSKKTESSPPVKENQSKTRKAALKRAALIGELYKIDPDHTRLPKLMEERWKALATPDRARHGELLAEIEKVTAHTSDEHLKIEGAYIRATLKLKPAGSKKAPDLSSVEEFLKLAPKDPRGAVLLEMAANVTRDAKKKAELVERLAREFPETIAEPAPTGPHNQSESIGKPFHLAFTNAIDGTAISMKTLKGKVVVIDFWATWCGPCVAEMPHMKELYAKYRNQGVEFIGVSLDRSREEGGLDSLQKFVQENEIAWPQYYQGNFWSSEFSKSWGINSIPCVFVVDAEGKLHSTQARGKLDEMIPLLLRKARDKVALTATTPKAARS